MSVDLIIICGATASGKSSLAIQIAKQLNTEIISADSLAIYKNLNIGTAKPTVQEQNKVKHHLIDVVSPFDTFTVSDYEKLALPIVNDLISRGKTPIICGGTGFYINSILYKLSYGGTTENSEIRAKFNKMLEEKGAEYVYNELKKVDIESANKLHYNDTVRVIRALEIFYSTGKKKSEQNDKLTPRFNYKAYSVSRPRADLYDRINKRVDIMIENGLFNEVKSLIDMGVTLENQCMQGIGYKEVYDGLIKGDMTGVSDEIKLNSRHYAKRQITFFKRLEGLTEVSSNVGDAINFILNDIKKG
ncbi:MAG: tRNA (adenosine(37)-N6)-dimethylallyltransferase MiaA [Clostridia bacterium]|nr:tRNA (adenosine(37)-N6)-dimethylallyltransferase MiaA [Clostridia bacterium]